MGTKEINIEGRVKTLKKVRTRAVQYNFGGGGQGGIKYETFDMESNNKYLKNNLEKKKIKHRIMISLWLLTKRFPLLRPPIEV